MRGQKDDTSKPASGGKPKISWLIFFGVFVLVCILVVYYFSDIKKEFILLEEVNPYWLVVAVSGQLSTYIISASIYLFLLKASNPGTFLPKLRSLARASVIALFFNQTMPSAGVSGNAFLFNFMARFNIPRDKIILIILAELLIFYAAMEAIIITLLTSCMFFYKSSSAIKTTLGAGMAVYLVFGIVIMLTGRNNWVDRLLNKMGDSLLLRKVMKNVTNQNAGLSYLGNDSKIISLLKNNKAMVWKAFSFQVLVVMSDAITLYALFLGSGYPISPFLVFVVLICAKIISILPFLPGALVLYESSMSFFFVSSGVPAGIAIIVTLMYRLLSFWLPIPLGTILYKKWLKDKTSE